ncbi:MAG: hypothetical protein HQK57_02265 [Deltaproteobacteria bacterium]|nr:hypothetical protein [Deltaproteobacteria bacterium]
MKGAKVVKKTEGERIKAWTDRRLAGGGKRVTVLLDGEAVEAMESLRLRKESNHDLVCRLLKEARQGIGSNVDAVTNQQILDELIRLRDVVTSNVNVSPVFEYKYSNVNVRPTESYGYSNVGAEGQTNLDGNIPTDVTHNLSGHGVSINVDGTPITEVYDSNVAVAPGPDYETISVDGMPTMKSDTSNVNVCLTGKSATINVDGVQAQTQEPEPTPPVPKAEVHPDLAAIRAMQDTGIEFGEIHQALRAWAITQREQETPFSALANMVNAAGIVARRGGAWLPSTVHRLIEDKKKA